MAGTIAGGKAAAATNIKRHGADFYAKLGAKGGKKGTGHQFAHGKISAAEAGRLGGQKTYELGKLKLNRQNRWAKEPTENIEAKAKLSLFNRLFR